MTTRHLEAHLGGSSGNSLVCYYNCLVPVENIMGPHPQDEDENGRLNKNEGLGFKMMM